MVGDPERRRPAHLLFWALFVTVLTVHLAWEALNDVPPAWDMAHHQLQGWHHLQAWQQGTLLWDFAGISTYYPPLYYLNEALVLRLFGWTTFLPLLTNLLGMLLLAYSTFRIASRYVGLPSAALAGILPLLFPLVAWTSRESLLDVSLCGWVAAAACLLVKSRLLQERRWSLILGLVLAAGMLTKWTFALFLLPPLAYALYASGDRRRSALNLADAGLLAAPPAMWWYLPNLQALIERFELTSQAAVLEGDPPLSSLWGWIYYPRCLSGYYLYLPLTLFLVVGLVLAVKARPLEGGAGRPGAPPGFLLAWLAGGMALLTLLEAKDPRYVMPLVSPLAVVLVWLWASRPRWLAAVFGLAFLQFLSVSFPHPLSPVKVALFELEDDSDYRTLGREWVLYQTHYFDVAGPPRREDWRYGRLLAELPAQARVGFLPELPRLHVTALGLKALRGGKDLEVERIGHSEESLKAIPEFDFIVGKTGAQGISYLTEFNEDAYLVLEQQGWPAVGEWKLPDGSRVRLWRNPNFAGASGGSETLHPIPAPR